MTDDVLKQAATILEGPPFVWRATVEYPGFLMVTFRDGVSEDNDRVYAAGLENPTLTVDRLRPADSEVLGSWDTEVPCVELDGYRLAIHVAAAIDRLEHEGE